MDLLETYKTLLKEYGPQGWWPVTPEGKTIPEYFTQIKTDRQRLEIVFGSILAQNTSWKNVEKAIENLNENSLVDIEKLKGIKQEMLEKIIRPSGFFRQKAGRLKVLASFISGYPDFLGKVKRGELLNVKGIGPETADSILLYACGKPSFVVDAYTKRIFNRLGLIGAESYQETKSFFEDNLPKDAALYNEFHALIVEHAKRFCRKKPECGKCPLRNNCIFSKSRKA